MKNDPCVPGYHYPISELLLLTHLHHYSCMQLNGGCSLSGCYNAIYNPTGSDCHAILLPHPQEALFRQRDMERWLVLQKGSFQ